MYQPIIDALRRGAHDEALTTARGLAAEHPHDAQALRWLGAAQAAAGDRSAALKSIDRAIALAPDDGDLQFQRAGLLLGTGQGAAADDALARSVQLDPNQFGAYVMQAQLALGRGDVDEAERLQRLAARIEPDHPWLQAVAGMVALRRGDVGRAQAILAAAAQQAPEDVQVRQALGFAYLEAGHLAFAEEAFRGVAEKVAGAGALRVLIADLMRRQGRPAEAAAELERLLADPALATPQLRRLTGELHLAAARHDLALPLLREALLAQPRDVRTYAALVECWRRNGDAGDARDTLDTALAAAPDNPDAWRARLAFEPMEGEGPLELVDRWLAAMPGHVPALEVRVALLDAMGREDEAEALAKQITALDPGNGRAELRLIGAMLDRNPADAVAHIDALLAQADASHHALLHSWKALALDRIGDASGAASLWRALRADEAEERLPLPPLSAAPIALTASGATGGERVSLLVVLPGAGADAVGSLLSGLVPAFRSDRLGAQPPQDALQRYDTGPRLRDGTVTGADVAESWLQALPHRGVEDEIVDWLLWWDNALLLALRERLPQALVVFALRDPRDMLLDWLAFGATPPLRMESPLAAAQWLAQALEHVAVLHEQDLQPHALLRVDDAVADPVRLARVTGEAFGVALPEPEGLALPPRFPAGHWRAYRDALAEPLALLTPMAVRLGYAED
jgi:predicted Zn-dependent protease